MVILFIHSKNLVAFVYAIAIAVAFKANCSW